MSKAAADRVYGDQRFLAAVHGIKMDKSRDPISKENSDGYIFGDPADCAHMTDQQKQEATDKLMGALRDKGVPIQIMENPNGR